MTKDQANAVYDILVQECGAWDAGPYKGCSADRRNFVNRQSESEVVEWRFCGALGFGGKFWRNAGRLYVNCYREDETPKRLAMIEKANERLAKLMEDSRMVPYSEIDESGF